jgi:hypothetical protein
LLVQVLFFVQNSLAGNFFSKSPTPPPSKVKWSAPKMTSIKVDDCFFTLVAEVISYVRFRLERRSLSTLVDCEFFNMSQLKSPTINKSFLLVRAIEYFSDKSLVKHATGQSGGLCVVHKRIDFRFLCWICINPRSTHDPQSRIHNH